MTTRAPRAMNARAVPRPMPREPPVITATFPVSLSIPPLQYFPSMTSVAIIGAGDLGGAVAQALAARDRVGRLLIVDAIAGAAAGKALDIRQSGAVSGFHTQ